MLLDEAGLHEQQAQLHGRQEHSQLKAALDSLLNTRTALPHLTQGAQLPELLNSLAHKLQAVLKQLVSFSLKRR